MKILKYKLYESKNPLLLISNNIDVNMINKIKGLLKKGSKILEISCGNSSDSIQLKKVGFDVKCTEINDDYIENALKNNIYCIKHNTINNFPFYDKEFDLVYSRLGLHYFNTDELNEIFKNIKRISKKYLLFSVKTFDDIPTGKVILSKSEWELIVSKYFNILSIVDKNGKLYNNDSSWLEILCEVRK